MNLSNTVAIDIRNSTKLIFFFGTPHLGSNVLDNTWIPQLERLAKAFDFKIPSKTRELLRPNCVELASINEEFENHNHAIEIVYVYEQKAMKGLNELVSHLIRSQYKLEKVADSLRWSTKSPLQTGVI